MSVNSEEIQKRMKQTTEIMWGIREALGFPVLRKPLIMLREQIKLAPQVHPQYTPYQTGQEEPRVMEGTESLPTSQPTLPIELPKLPLPNVLRERIEKRRVMPIRSGIAEVLHSYSEYISSPRQRKREGEEEAYEEQEKEMPYHVSQMSEARLKRKGIYKEHGIEM